MKALYKLVNMKSSISILLWKKGELQKRKYENEANILHNISLGLHLAPLDLAY